MLKQDKNMENHLLDMKVYLMSCFFVAVSFSDSEIVMKIIVFILTVGYTGRRWYLLEKNKKE